MSLLGRAVKFLAAPTLRVNNFDAIKRLHRCRLKSEILPPAPAACRLISSISSSSRVLTFRMRNHELMSHLRRG
jgi:hypothetical protein